MKEQVNSLKTLVDALNGNKFITNYTESDDGWSITFNDGKTITIRDGEKGADAPVLGIARFEGVYYWTLGGADEWLLDDAGSKIPVAGQDGKTPSVVAAVEVNLPVFDDNNAGSSDWEEWN